MVTLQDLCVPVFVALEGWRISLLLFHHRIIQSIDKIIYDNEIAQFGEELRQRFASVSPNVEAGIQFSQIDA